METFQDVSTSSDNANITLHCGLSKLRAEIAVGLAAFGFSIVETSVTHLILDAPLGWALWKSENLAAQRIFVVTDNPCPEYKLRLLNQKPLALMSQVSLKDIGDILCDEGFEALPRIITPLSKAEAFTLYLVATDHSNCAISHIRNIQEQTVKNTICTIFDKLCLKNRLQAAHYYFGNWYLLCQNGWTPPAHLVLPEYLQQSWYLGNGTKVL